MEVLTYAESVDANDTHRQKRRVSKAGKITHLAINFPASSYGLSVRINEASRGKDRQILPTEDDTFFVWGDDSTLGMDLDLPVKTGAELEVEWVNDTGGGLTCPVVITVES